MKLTDLELALIPYSSVVALEGSLLKLPRWLEEEQTLNSLHDYVLANSTTIARYRKNGTGIYVDNADDVRAAMERRWLCRGEGVQDLLGTLGTLARELLATSNQGMPSFRFGDLSLGHLALLNERIDCAAFLCVWAAWGNDVPLEGSELKDEHFWLASHVTPLAPDPRFDSLAETHLHVNAVLNTEIAWCLTVATPGHALRPDWRFCACNFSEGGPWDPRGLTTNKSLNPWLEWAAITRELLARYSRSHPGSGEDFVVSSERWFRERVALSSVGVGQVFSAWRQGLFGDAKGLDRLSVNSFAQVLAQLRGMSQQEEKSSLVESSVLAERRWLVEALGVARGWREQTQSCSGQTHEPCEFDRALLQYLRVRNLFHRHLVYSGRHGGFRGFSSLFRRGSRYVKYLISDEGGLTFAFGHLDSGRKAKFVEFRHATAVTENQRDAPHSVASMDQTLRSLWRFEAQPHQPKGGLIFHFLKRRTVIRRQSESLKSHIARLQKLMPLDGEASLSEVDTWRHGRAFAFLLKQARPIHGMWSVDTLNYWILGYDIAGVEEDCPTWPFLATFRKLRDSSKNVAVRRPRTPGIQFTIHAGEMFSHIVAGLFRIGQAVRFLKEDEHGRIGHALALSPDEPSRGLAWIKNEDWLMAVCWATEFLGGPDTAPPELRKALREGIQDLQEHGINASDNNLITAYRYLENYKRLAEIGFPFRKASSATNPVQKLMVNLLTDFDYAEWAESCQERCDMPDDVLTTIREKLRGELKLYKITIEACPTSNLAIGLSRTAIIDDEGGYNHHPSLSLYGDSDIGQPLQVSLNTDDPLQFATDLATEHWRMYNAAKKQGIDADDWLEKRIADAKKSLFISQQYRPPAANAREEWDRAKKAILLREHTGENGLISWYHAGTRF
jgi:hypothetical protein